MQSKSVITFSLQMNSVQLKKKHIKYLTKKKFKLNGNNVIIKLN